MPANARVTGTVKFFNEKKGFGFVKRDDGSGDVFIHVTQLPDGISNLRENQELSFEVEDGRRGVRAVRVSLV